MLLTWTHACGAAAAAAACPSQVAAAAPLLGDLGLTFLVLSWEGVVLLAPRGDGSVSPTCTLSCQGCCRCGPRGLAGGDAAACCGLAAVLLRCRGLPGCDWLRACLGLQLVLPAQCCLGLLPGCRRLMAVARGLGGCCRQLLFAANWPCCCLGLLVGCCKSVAGFWGLPPPLGPASWLGFISA